MANADDEKELLELAVEELRRLHDSVSDGFNHLRTKALALSGGEVAIVTFLLSVDGHPMHFPGVIYGVVALAIGVMLMGLAFVLFLWVLSPSGWSHPPDTKRTRKLSKDFHGSPVEFLEYLKDEYNDTIEVCIRRLNARAEKFKWAMYSLAIGVFILLMLKYGGGTIHL